MGISQGFNVGSLLMAVFSAALIYQGYALFKNNSGARRWAIVSSSIIAICSGSIAIIILTFKPEQNLIEILSDTWPVLGGAITVSVVYIMVSILLIVNKSNIPNKASQPTQQSRG